MRTNRFFWFLFFFVQNLYALEKPDTHIPTECFIKNMGQIASIEKNEPISDVLYYIKTNQATLYVTKNGLSYVFYKHDYEKNEKDDFQTIKTTHWQRVDLELESAQLNNAEEIDKIPWTYNFYYAHCPDGIKNVPAFKTLYFNNIYPHIDFKIYFKDNNLKYDFIVHPGGNVQNIKLIYKYAKNVTIKEDGSVLVESDLGTIQDHKPIAFQHGSALRANWNLTNNNTITFNIPAYNANEDLIIDPMLIWSTYLGGTGNDPIMGLDVNNSFIVVSGATSSSNLPTYNPGGSPFFQGSNAGSNDFFIGKFKTGGQLQWLTYYGGSGDEQKAFVKIVNNQYIYVYGQTFSTNFPTYNPGGGAYYQSSIGDAASSDAAFIKFDTVGTRMWATYFGGVGSDACYSLINNNNDVFFGLTAYSEDIPTVNPGGGAWNQDLTTTSSAHVYIGKFSISNNQQTWGTYFSGPSEGSIDNNWGSVTATNSYVYYLFKTSANDIPTLNLAGAYFDNTLNGSNDLILTRFTSGGALQWSTYFGGNGTEDFRSIFIDANNNLWIGGSTNSTDYPTLDIGNGAYFQSTGNGNLDGAISRFTGDGQLLWSTYYGGTNHDYIYDIYSDNLGVYVTGNTYSSNFPLYNPGTPTFYDNTYYSTDPFIIKFKINGKRQWASLFSALGKPSKVRANNQHFFIGGIMYSTGLSPMDPGNGAYFQGSSGGSQDGFIAKFDKCVIPNVTITSTPSAICLYDTSTLLVQGDDLVGYLWNTSSTNNPYAVSPSSTTNYTVSVVDDMTCTNSTSTSITVYPLPNVQISGEQPICFSDSIKLYANGATTYVWSYNSATTDSVTVSPLSSTMYYVTGTDANGCKNIDSATVVVNPLPNVQISGEQPICFGDSIKLYGNGATTYVWSYNSATTDSVEVSPLNTTDYYVTGTDANGCKNIDSATVVVNPLPNVQISGEQPICFGDSIKLYGNGATTYVWSYNSETTDSVEVSPLNTTDYYVTGTDANGCKNIDTAQVIVYPLPNVQITGDQPICFGDSIKLYANGATTYVWSYNNATTDSVTVSPLNSTVYYVTGTDANSCKNIDSAQVIVNPLPNVQITGEHPICFGDIIKLYGNGATTYVWSYNSATTDSVEVSPLNTTDYYVTGTDANGCKNIDTAQVIVYPLPNVQILGAHPICINDSITLTAINADSYVWNTTDTLSTITVSPQQTFNYIVVGTDTNGCSKADTSQVIVNPLPGVQITGEHPICLYDSISLSATGAATYTWSPWGYTDPNINISPDSTTQITLVGTDINGCVNSDSATLVVYSLPQVSVTGFHPICYGDSITLIANGANTYQWSPINLSGEQITFSPTQTENYTVLGTDTNQCKDTANFTITVYELPVANISGIDRICQEETVTLTASGGDSYIWNTTETSTSIEVIPMQTTTYSVIAIKNICSDTAYFTLNVDPKPTLTLTQDTTIIIGMSLPLQVSGANNYVWTPVTYLSCTSCNNPNTRPSETIEYCVEGINSYGCSDTACVVVTVDKECGETFIPTGFSPNNDGNNDVLYVRSKCLKSMEFVIYNRWGEKVFETTDPDIGWDGTFRGKNLDTGVFVYVLKAEYYNGAIINQHGNITLIR